MKKQVRSRYSLIAMAVFVVAAVVVACQSGPPKIGIKSPEAMLMASGNAMVSMTIENKGGSDVLNGVSTDIPGAEAMIHIMKGNHMQHVRSLPIPGGETVLKKGSSHIMIVSLPKTMTAGSPFTLTLTFEKSGAKELHLKLEGKTAPMSSMPSMPMKTGC